MAQPDPGCLTSLRRQSSAARWWAAASVGRPGQVGAAAAGGEPMAGRRDLSQHADDLVEQITELACRVAGSCCFRAAGGASRKTGQVGPSCQDGVGAPGSTGSPAGRRETRSAQAASGRGGMIFLPNSRTGPMGLAFNQQHRGARYPEPQAHEPS